MASTAAEKHHRYNCVDQKLVRSDQFVNFDAEIKVRTNVRLLDVEIEAGCVCADNRHHNHGSKSERTMSQKYVKADNVTVVTNQKTVEKPAREPSPKRKSSPGRKSSHKEVVAGVAAVNAVQGDNKATVAGVAIKTDRSVKKI